jgi:superfamily I DNA/RNA helicase
VYIRKSNTYLLPCKCFLFYPDLCQVFKKSGWSVAEELVDVFNKITDEQINIDSKDFNDEEKLEDYCKVYPTYKLLLCKNRLFDFATIHETLLKAFQCNPKFAEAIKNNFDYFFVDEFQDVNNIQDLIFKTISALK